VAIVKRILIAIPGFYFDDIEDGEGNHLSIIKLKSRDSNENALNNCHEMESLVVNGHGPPKIMQNTDFIGVEVQQDSATEMKNNGSIIMSNGHGIYGKPKG
jgi:hypothetical protein